MLVPENRNIFILSYRLQTQYEKVVEQNRELQKENRKLKANIEGIVNRTVDIVLEKLHIKHDKGGD